MLMKLVLCGFTVNYNQQNAAVRCGTQSGLRLTQQTGIKFHFLFPASPVVHL